MSTIEFPVAPATAPEQKEEIREGLAEGREEEKAATDASDRISRLEAALKEKEAIIEAFSNASRANTEAARAATAAAAQARAEEGNVTVTGSEAGEAEEDGSSSFLAVEEAHSELDSPSSLHPPALTSPPRPQRSSLRKRDSVSRPSGSSSPIEGSSSSARQRSSSTGEASSSSPPAARRQQNGKIYADQPEAQFAYRNRRLSGASTRSNISIRVDAPSRRSSLSLQHTNRSSVSLHNGNRDGLSPATDYGSDTGTSSSLWQSGKGNKSPGNNSNWTSRFRRAPSPSGTGESSLSTSDTLVSHKRNGSGLGSAWKRSSLIVGRRRKNGSASLDQGLTSPVGGVNTSSFEPTSGGLEPLREAGARSAQLSADGFSAPTIASENRRLANLHTHALATSTAVNLPAGSNTAPGAPGIGSSSKVIMALTTELQATKNLLDNTRSALRASQRSTSAAQRGLDDAKEALGRSRLENENTSRMLERKERQLQEGLERARKAEVEAKEFGRQSRDWGTRVRSVEEELGELRREKAKFESQYEAIRTSWDSTREKWKKDVEDLRKQVAERDQKRAGEVGAMKMKMEEMEALWKKRSEEKAELEGVLAQLREESDKVGALVQQHIGPISKQADFIEEEEKRLGETVDQMHRELKRILRLARAGETEG